MPKKINGIQRRGTYPGSTKGYSDYDYPQECEEFVVKKWSYPKTVSIKLFFRGFKNPKEGVGLGMLSVEVAIAVGRALLMVGEGYTDEVTVRL